MSKKPALVVATLALSLVSIAAPGPSEGGSRPVASDPLICPLCGGGFAHFQALLRTTLNAGIRVLVESRVR